MKRFLSLLATGALALGLSASASAQVRGIGAGALVLDDYHGHTITVQTPQDPSAAWSAWSAEGFPNLITLSPPPFPGLASAFIYPGVGATVKPYLSYWLPSGVTSPYGTGNSGGVTGAWDYATAAQLDLVSESGLNNNQIPEWSTGGGNFVGSSLYDNGTTVSTAESFSATGSISGAAFDGGTGSFTALTTSGTNTLGALGLGVVHSSSAGVLSSSPVSLTTDVSGILPPANGGTGENNGSNTITLTGPFATVGGNSLTFTTTGSTNITLPTSGTLVTTTTLDNNTLPASVTTLNTSGANTLGALTSNGVVQTTGGTGFLTVAPVTNAELVNSSINFTYGTGISGPASIALGGSGLLTNTGVTSLAGTANQITASAATGAVTLSLPATLVAPGTFEATTSIQDAGLTTAGIVTNDASGNLGTVAQIPIANGGTNGTATPTAGAVAYGTGSAYAFSAAGTSGQVLTSGGAGVPTWTPQSSLAIPFSSITSGTNTTAAMVVGAGSSLNYTSTGTINASSLIGATWAAPGAIGTTTPAAGNFTSIGVTTQGSGAFTSLSSNAGLTVSADGASIAGGINNNTGGITNAGGISGATGISSSGTITFSGIGGLGIVHSSAGGLLSSSAVNLASADVTGTLPIANGGTNGTATPTAGAVAYGTGSAYAFSAAGTSGQVLTSGGAGVPTWTPQSSLAIPFSSITSGTNTTAAMVVGAGSSLNYTSTGTINASSLIGATWAAPGAIGTTTPAAGNFTSIGVTTQGSGAFTSLSSNAGLTVSADGASIAGGINNNTGGITNAGGISGATGISSSGTITFSGIGGLGIVHSSAGGLLSSSAVNLASADVTGTLPIANGGTNGTATPTAGAVAYGTGSAYAFSAAGTSGQVLTSGGAGVPTWTPQSSLAIPFSSITSGTNTTAAMVVGAGSSLNYTSTGTINASSLIGATWAAPGAIGTTTPAAGNFTSIGVTTQGSGAFTSLSSNAGLTVSADGASIAGGINNNTGGITNAGGISGATGISSSGTITFSGIGGLGIVHSSAGGLLSSSAVNLASADVTGTLPIANGGTNGTATPTAGAVAYGTGSAYAFSAAGTSGQVLTSGGAGVPTWTPQSSLAIPFSSITSGTNTTAAMVVGAGSSLNYTSTGTINASSLIGATWAAPGAIGTTTPAAGNFTSIGVTTQGSGAFTTLSSSGLATLNSASVTTTLGVTGLATLNGGLTEGGTVNINQSSAAATNISGGTGNTSIGNNTGTTQIAGSNWNIATSGAGTFTTLASSGTPGTGVGDLSITNTAANAVDLGASITVSGAGTNNRGLSFAVTGGGTSNTDIVGTGGNWFVSSAGNFSSPNGGSINLGTDAATAGSVTLHSAATGASFSGTLRLLPTAGLFTTANRAYSFQDASGTVAFLADITGSVDAAVNGSSPNIPVFTGAHTIGNSLLSDNGSNLIYNGNFNVSSAGAVTGVTTLDAGTSITDGGLTAAGIVTNTSGGALGTVTLVPLANGGTDADLSGTGGASEVLMQTTSGGAVTVGQLASTDISGLGTMATQNADAVTIIGGTIDGTVIGSTSAAAGSFTTLEATTSETFTNLSTAGIVTNTSGGALGTVTLVPLANGGTDADLSGTGGASEVLMQTTSGGAVTVGQLASTDISGLGTMATQNADAVTIIGGTIDGTVIGSTSAAAGSFTTLEATTSETFTNLSTAGIVTNTSGGALGTVTLVPLANGGTDADLSGTGGASEVLMQTTSGGAVTVGQLASTDISGLGTMATQNADAVTIIGGTIDGTVIGSTSAAAGSFTTLEATTSETFTNLSTAGIVTNTSGGALGTVTLVPLANGGTDADLSGTGGASEVLMQTTSGGAVTVGQLASTDISGLGTMATQNADAVTIIGGTIDGTVIGSTSAAAGSFTTLGVSGTSTLTGNVGIGQAPGSDALDVTGTATITGSATITAGLTSSGSTTVGGTLNGAGNSVGTNFAETTSITGTGATADFTINNTQVTAHSVIIVTTEPSSASIDYTTVLKTRTAGTSFTIELGGIPATGETVAIDYIIVNP